MTIFLSNRAIYETVIRDAVPAARGESHGPCTTCGDATISMYTTFEMRIGNVSSHR